MADRETPAPDRESALSDRELQVTANLRLDVDGDEIRVYDRNGILVVDAGSFRAVRKLFAGVEALPVDPARLSPAAGAAGVDVVIEVRHAVVARLGPGTDPGPLSRLLTRRSGVPAAVDWRGTLVALGRRLL